MQFRYTVIITNKWMQVGTTVSTFMVVTMIGVTIRFYINIFPVCHYRTTFGAGNSFYKIKTECSGITNCSQKFSFV